MKRRIRRLAQQWATAANRLDAKLEQRWRDQKKVKDRECWLFFVSFDCNQVEQNNTVELNLMKNINTYSSAYSIS